MAEQIRYDHYLHGGDYNPERGLDRPDILKKISNISKKPISIPFPWECFPGQKKGAEEGRYNFDWLEEVIDNLYVKEFIMIFSTPSGARPKWMADKYEEVLRMDPTAQEDFSVEDIITKYFSGI